jgi:hypothetical protein
VSTSTVPVTRDGLGVECHHHTGDLSDPLLEKGYRLAHKCCKSRLKRVQKLHPYLKNVAGNPHLVTSRNADRGTDLELPLNQYQCLPWSERRYFRIQHTCWPV